MPQTAKRSTVIHGVFPLVTDAIKKGRSAPFVLVQPETLIAVREALTLYFW